MPSENIDNIVNLRLKGQFEIDSKRKAIGTTMSCVAPSSSNRPTMSHMVKELIQCLPMEMIQQSSQNESPSKNLINVSFERIIGD